MPLADVHDINAFLPTDKIAATEGNEETDRTLLDAERLIRGHLAGVYEPATLATWSDPDNTPELIRSIAGRLAAAFFYRMRYAVDLADVPEYAQTLYNEAMMLIDNLKTGNVTLEEVTVDVTDVPNRAFFWPNDDTPTPAAFRMDMEF
jgi:hypothetical protein